MLRARLHVPHGGAAKMPARFGASSQVINKDWPALVVRSAIIMGAIELNFLWSTPNAECTPLAFRAAVKRPDPANNSMRTGPSLENFRFWWLMSAEGLWSKLLWGEAAMLELTKSTCRVIAILLSQLCKTVASSFCWPASWSAEFFFSEFCGNIAAKLWSLSSLWWFGGRELGCRHHPVNGLALAALCHNPDAKPMQWRIQFPSSLLPFRRWASSSCHKQVT